MLFFVASLVLTPSSWLIRGGTVYDGVSTAGRKVDVRIVGDTIREIGHLKVRTGEQVIDATGLVVAPGFIDAHSHASGGIFEDPNAETQIRQGITTAVVGEDGSSEFPLQNWFDKLLKSPTAINFASFVGHGTVREQVMGDSDRKSTPEERKKMADLVAQEMKAGALGLSTGLEYQPGRYADTDEVVALATSAAKYKGIYISHMRNEDNTFFDALHELIDIARRAKIPAQVNHIKIGSARVWGRAGEALNEMAAARKAGLDITADVYPYLYWQSTIRVIIPTEQFDDREQWRQGLADIGGPEHVLLTRYTPDPTWQGLTIAQISERVGKDPITVIQEIIERCHGKGATGSESVVVTAMSEADLKAFIVSPLVMFCSDGGLHGSHPRGAGSFPRILGEYVREQRVIPLGEAIRKMTSVPARRFKLTRRGQIAVGYKADITIFDAQKVHDTATTHSPQAKPDGLPTVLVNGEPVLRDGAVTGAHPGRPLRRG